MKLNGFRSLDNLAPSEVFMGEKTNKIIQLKYFTMLIFPLTPNVVFVTESEDVSSTCLVGKTISNDHSRQLAFTPDLFVFLL